MPADLHALRVWQRGLEVLLQHELKGAAFCFYLKLDLKIDCRHAVMLPEVSVAECLSYKHSASEFTRPCIVLAELHFASSL